MKIIKDKDSIMHKILTYGVAFLLIILTAMLSPGRDKLPNNAGTYIIIFILYYTIISQRILETLLFATAFGIALLNGRSFTGKFVEQLYSTMADGDFAWIVLMCCFLNVFNKLLGKTGSLHAFSNLIKKKIKKKSHLNVAAWLMQFPLFFDDYMTVSIGGGMMAPIYDEMEVPREDGAFIMHTLAEPLRVLLPVTSWAAFLGSLFVSGGMGKDGTGMLDFFKTIPFNFYPIVAIIGAGVFAFGITPRFGLKSVPDREKYMEIEEIVNDKEKIQGNLLDFFLPLFFMIFSVFIFHFDIVPAMIVVLPVTIIYYLIRGIISTEDVEGSFVEGFGDYISLILLFCLSYMLNAVLSNLGYVNYLADLIKHFINPKFLPFIIFVILSISEGIMSLNWGLMLIAFPMLLPVANSIGANPYLTAGSIISAGCLGCNFCYICDYTMLTSSVFGLKADYHASNCLPYTIVWGVISAILFLVAGLMIG